MMNQRKHETGFHLSYSFIIILQYLIQVQMNINELFKSSHSLNQILLWDGINNSEVLRVSSIKPLS